jgi:hypothetical protein
MRELAAVLLFVGLGAGSDEAILVCFGTSAVLFGFDLYRKERRG